MSNETMRTLQQPEKLLVAKNRGRRFIRANKAEEIFGMERRALVDDAREWGALYRKNNIELIDLSVFEPRFAEKYKA